VIINLLITTKNKNSFKKILYFLKKNIKKKFNNITFYFPKKKNKKVITLLKSPHVNKTAQEQFEVKYFSIKLKIFTTKMFKFLIFLKKINNFLFADIQIKTKFLTSSKKQFLLKRQIININNFLKVLFFKNKNYVKIKNFNEIQITKKNYFLNNNKKYLTSKKLFKIFDFFGH
jgi:ribosomal protein S10